MELLRNTIKEGISIKDVYKVFLDYIKSNGKEDYLKNLPKVLGYGIGMNPKEELLSIKEDNDKVIDNGMVFNIRLSLAHFDKL
jgi:nucleosome binding factor SPN SPT16 subunit